jgi:hypothetical protein
VTRLLAAAVLLALVVSGTALAARGDPKRQLRPADQVRAKAIVLRQADLGGGFKPAPSSPGSGGDLYCKALDQSDLTLTGEAESEFKSSPFTVSSSANLYETVADANAAWRRGTSKAGTACLRNGFRAEFAKQGAALLAFKRVPFPRLGQRSFAMRLVARSQGVKVYLDFIVLQHSRAQTSAAFISPFAPVVREGQVRLTRLLASRTKTALRGS